MSIVSSNENEVLKLHPQVKEKDFVLNYHQPFVTKRIIVQNAQNSLIDEFSMLIVLL